MNKSLAVYVSSFDGYSWLWPAFFHFFKKYWPDCPYEVYLGTETVKPQQEGIKVLYSGKRGTWGETTLSNLEQIKADYVLWLQDDYFLTKKVRTEEIEESLDLLISSNGKYLRLTLDDIQHKGIRRTDRNEKISKISDDYGVLCSLQSAIWERKFLIGLVDKDETPWDFERNGNKKSLPKGTFYAVKRTLINYIGGGATRQGKLIRHYYRFFLKANLPVDGKYVMSVSEDIQWYIIFILSNLYLFFLVKKLKALRDRISPKFDFPFLR